VAHGRLTPLHRGVYRVGPLDGPFTGVMAAVLACGPRAVASHDAAAHLHGFREWRGAVDVTVPEGQRRHRPGVRVHRRPLEADEVTTAHGIPVTTPERTIRDLAAATTTRELARAIEEAQIQRRLDEASLARAVRRAAGRRGARALRAAAPEDAPSLTRSEAERRLLELIRASGLPRPVTNARVARYEVDALWPEERLVVEVDGFAYHGGRGAFERDRRKDADLLAAGHRVLRVTWRQLADEPHAVVARVASALATGRSRVGTTA
jgi:very-short-patch-repair endonuclease